MDRYLRQTLLKEIGPEGQEILSRSRILCVGAGGLGAPAAMYLVAAGVGSLGLIDGDQVDMTNLQRQVLFAEGDVGEDKVEAAARRLRTMNSSVSVQTFPYHLNAENALEVFSGYDVILDGTDNFSTKFLINDAAAKLGLPLVYGSISQFDGQVSVFWKGHGPCYRCLHPKAPSSRIPNCAESGVVGSVGGVIGSMMALEALKVALLKAGFQTSLKALVGTMVVINMADIDMIKVKIPKRSDCVCCRPAQEIVLDGGYNSCRLPWDRTVHEVSSEEVARRLENGGVVIDVREEREWLEGHIPTSRHWALSRFMVGEYPSGVSKNDALVVLCHGGVRAEQAAALLVSQGYQDVSCFLEGMPGWAGPISKGF